MMYRADFELLPSPVQHALGLMASILMQHTDYEGVQITIETLRGEDVKIAVDVKVAE
jgi:hypothetical protein